MTVSGLGGLWTVIRDCKEGSGGKSQRCLSSTAGSVYVAIEFIAAGRRDIQSTPGELLLFMQKYKNYFEIASQKKGITLNNVLGILLKMAKIFLWQGYDTSSCFPSFLKVLFSAHLSKMVLTCSCIVRGIDIAGNSAGCPLQMGDFSLCQGKHFNSEFLYGLLAERHTLFFKTSPR